MFYKISLILIKKNFKIGLKFNIEFKYKID